MTDEKFNLLKQEIEAELGLGRPIQQDEEITLKGLYYFGKGLKLRNQLDSEPERLGDICKRVLPEIRERMEQNRRKHQVSIFGAVKDFFTRKPGRNKRSSEQKDKQGILW